MYKCDICGREIFKKTCCHGYTLCSKHYHQLHTYGKFLDNNPRSSRDYNHYEIKGDCVIFDVYNQRQEKNGEFIIDLEDLDKVKYHKWRKSYGRIVTGNNMNSNPTIYLTHLLLDLKETGYNNVIDHIDGNPSNNRKSNLRVCTQGDNTCNKKFMSNNTSGIIGVSKDHRPNRKTNWCAEIRYNEKRWHIGAYVTIEEAAYARRVAEDFLFKEYRHKTHDEELEKLFAKIPQKRKEEIEKYVLNKVKH